ncbi:MAG TPA: low affinity iron permease family protein [Xanthomonadaceae bacterium]|nr:low affinity iron permease family protein [Xanthomonadaceae bacterium]
MAKGKQFGRIAKGASRFTGGALCFGLALGAVAVWVATGPMFDYSNNWQLAINTGTTIITFLMVFLIQNSQNRDTDAIHVKLDELIRATHGAHNALLDLEDLEPSELAKFRASYSTMAAKRRIHQPTHWSRKSASITWSSTEFPRWAAKRLQPKGTGLPTSSGPSRASGRGQVNFFRARK